jgi:hypothetical protein
MLKLQEFAMAVARAERSWAIDYDWCGCREIELKERLGRHRFLRRR